MINFIRTNKYPILISVIFFIILYQVAFFHHIYWADFDGIHYFHSGEQIISGHGANVKFANSPLGGPVLFSILDLIFEDAFSAMKLLSLMSSTGIVFISYYVIKNIFDTKVALIGQLFVAFNPVLHISSIEAMNEMFPIVLIILSLYFVTKKQIKISHLVIIGLLLGASSLFRLQAAVVLFSIIIFLLIQNKNFQTKLFHSSLAGISFIISFSPLLIYNQITYGTLVDQNSNLWMLWHAKYQTYDWFTIMTTSMGTASGIFTDFNLFLKNYFYNLFYHNPNLLFHFSDSARKLTIFPPLIPFINVILAIGGLIYCLNVKINRNTAVLAIASFIITTSLILLLGDLEIHFFAIIILPLLIIGISNIKKIQKNLLPLLILPVIYFLVISIIPLGRAEHVFPIWISVVLLSSIFFAEVIPKTLSKIISSRGD